MRQRSPFLAGFALSLALLAVGCDSSDPDDAVDPVVMEFDFATSGSGWSADFVDFPQEQEADVEFVGDHRELPGPLGPNRALYQRGFNLSDDLFMYFKHQVDDLEPETDYAVSFRLDYVSNYGQDCDIGVGAGVYLKTGASRVQPTRVIDSEGHVRLNVDKGQQQNDGANALLIGDVRNGEPGCGDDVPYAMNTADSNGRTLQIRSDESGSVWVFVGSESAFESPHEVYFTGLRVEFIRIEV